MTDVEGPLRRHLEDGFDEADLQRNWRGIQRRLLRREATVTAKQRLRPALVLGAAMAMLLVGVWLSQRPSKSEGPLRFAEGQAAVARGTVLESNVLATELSDGSKVTLTRDGRLEVLENGAELFRLALHRGASTFEVEPGGPRRWIVEAGLATVEVIGTKFSVQRTTDSVEVTVHRGVVLVRGDRVPGGIRRLEAGRSITLHEPAAVEPGQSSDPEPLPAAPAWDGDASVLSTQSPPATAIPTNARSAAPRSGLPSHERVKPAASLASRPVPSPALTDRVEPLMREADEARRVGDQHRATELLRRVVEDARGDPRAALAAFTLARWVMDDDPRQAAALLSRMLDDGAPRGLEEDARARLVEAHARAGNREGAEAAAADYEHRFPDGTRLADVRRWAHR